MDFLQPFVWRLNVPVGISWAEHPGAYCRHQYSLMLLPLASKT